MHSKIATVLALVLVGLIDLTFQQGENNNPAANWDRVAAGFLIQEPQPLTLEQAKLENFDVLDTTCDPNHGFRARMPGRMTPTVMFDSNGAFAGIQAVTDPKTYGLYPTTNLILNKTVFVEDDSGEVAMSFFFTDPTTICNAPAKTEVIGDRLWMRTGCGCGCEDDYIPIPLYEDEMIKKNGKNMGGCAASGFIFPGSPGMGQHYWYNINPNTTPCQDLGPAFFMYNKGVMNAFGLAFSGLQQNVPTDGAVKPTSPIDVPPYPELWEFPYQPLDPFFFRKDNMPDCFENLNLFDASVPYGNVTAATIHFHLSDPLDITCAK